MKLLSVVFVLSLFANTALARKCDYEAYDNSASTTGGTAVSGNSLGADSAEDNSFSVGACSENNTVSAKPGSGVSGNEVKVSQIQGSIFTIQNDAADNRGSGTRRSSVTSGNRVRADRVQEGDIQCLYSYCYTYYYYFFHGPYEYCYCYDGYELGDASQGNIQQTSKNNTGVVSQGEVLSGNAVEIASVEGSYIDASSEATGNNASVSGTGDATSGNTNEFGSVQEEVYYGYSYYSCDYYYCYYYGYCSGCEPDVIAAAVAARNNATNNFASVEDGAASSGNKNTIGSVRNTDVDLVNTATGNEAGVDYYGEALSGNKNEISNEFYGYSSRSTVVVDNVAEENRASSNTEQAISGNDNKFNMIRGSQVSSAGVARGNIAQGGSGDSVSGNRNMIDRANVRRIDDTAQGNTATSNSQGNAIAGNYLGGSATLLGDDLSMSSSGNNAQSEDGLALSGNVVQVGSFGRKLMA